MWFMDSCCQISRTVGLAEEMLEVILLIEGPEGRLSPLTPPMVVYSGYYELLEGIFTSPLLDLLFEAFEGWQEEGRVRFGELSRSQGLEIYRRQHVRPNTQAHGFDWLIWLLAEAHDEDEGIPRFEPPVFWDERPIHLFFARPSMIDAAVRTVCEVDEPQWSVYRFLDSLSDGLLLERLYAAFPPLLETMQGLYGLLEADEARAFREQMLRMLRLDGFFQQAWPTVMLPRDAYAATYLAAADEAWDWLGHWPAFREALCSLDHSRFGRRMREPLEKSVALVNWEEDVALWDGQSRYHPLESYQRGDIFFHPQLGLGMVIDKDEDDEYRIEVQFRGVQVPLRCQPFELDDIGGRFARLRELLWIEPEGLEEAAREAIWQELLLLFEGWEDEQRDTALAYAQAHLEPHWRDSWRAAPRWQPEHPAWELCRAAIVDASSKAQVEQMTASTHLTELRLIRCFWKDLHRVSELPQLQLLEVRGCAHLERVEALAGCAKLHTLILEGCHGLQSVEALASLPALAKLDLSGSPVPSQIQGLAALEGLEFLCLQECQHLSDLRGVPRGPALRSLWLFSCRGLQSLEGLPASLRELRVMHCGQLSEFSALALVPQLEILEIRDCNVGSTDAVALSKIPFEGLQELDLSDNLIGNGGARALLKSPHFQGLRLLDFRDNRLSDALEAELQWRALTQGADLSTLPAYNLLQEFQAGDVFEHRKFGVGVVVEREQDKIQVRFEEGIRTLVHNQG